MKLYLAGGEGEIEDIAREKPPYILMSFLMAKEKGMRLAAEPWCKGFLLDSGAFTFFWGRESKTWREWEEYVDKYIEAINAFGINQFFELDIDRIVGLEKVEALRRRIERGTGKQPIPVWHINRGWDYFKRMCAEYKYVALGTVAGVSEKIRRVKYEKTFPYFINYAHEQGCKIHGLGYTSIMKFKEYPFDSVDSTSWLSGGQWGHTYQCSPYGISCVRAEKRYPRHVLNVHNLRVWAQYARILDV